MASEVRPRLFGLSLALSLGLGLIGGLPFTPRVANAAEAQPTSQPSPEEQQAAARQYESGVAFFQAGNYSAARAEFEAAYKLTHYPDLLYNLAKVAQKEGRTDDEIRFLQDYLETNPRDADLVRTRLDNIRPRQQHPAAATTEPVKTAPPTPAGAFALIGGGAAALIIGIACGGAAIAAANTVADPMNTGKPFTPDLLNTQQRGQQLSSAAIALDVIGGVALAGGGAWLGYWLYQRQQAKKQAAPQPQTAVLPTGLGIILIRSY